MNQNTFVANYLKQFNDPNYLLRCINVTLLGILFIIFYMGYHISWQISAILDNTFLISNYLQNIAPAQTYQDFSEQVFPGQVFPEIETY